MVAKATTKTKKGAAKKSKKSRRKVKQGIVYIQSTYNNTLVSVCDAAGNVLAWSSAGRVGFSGARKATPFAAQQAVADVMERLQPFAMEEAQVVVKGIGSARDSAVRAFGAAGLTITAIKDVTPIPHNGVRPPKRRRV